MHQEYHAGNLIIRLSVVCNVYPCIDAFYTSLPGAHKSLTHIYKLGTFLATLITQLRNPI